MSKTIFPWVKPLGLSSSNFSQKPDGADTLVWGLKNNIIDEDEYMAWASEFYQCPAIKPEFFSMAVDFTLIEKYANLYDWFAYCYPIYQWEDTLFVACLEPPKASINMKTCYVIAPFHPLESAWQKFNNSRPGIAIATEQLPIVSDVPPPSLEDANESNQEISTSDQSRAEVLPETQEPIIPPPPLETLKTEEPFIPPPPVEAQKSNEPIIPPPPIEALNTDEPIIPPPPVEDNVSQQHPLDGASLDFGDLKKEMGVDEKDAQTLQQESPSNSTEELGVLDFSNMDDNALGNESPPESPKEEARQVDEHNSEVELDERSADEITHTKVDEGLNNLTSATQTMHASQHTMTATSGATEAPPLPFEEVTIKGISLEGEKTEIDVPQEEKTKISPAAAKQKTQPTAKVKANDVNVPPPPPQHQPINDENSIPSLDELKVHQTENPKQAPGLEQSDINLEKENQDLNEEFEDDYTPVPILTKAQQEAQEQRKKEARLKAKQEGKGRLTENTITDHAQPILTPPDNLISDQEIKEASDLSEASSMKQVLAHMFGHLKRDYQKLMWIEMNKEDRYFIKYVYGDWKITELAWKMHVNITNPNIFRVAYKSGHPFHGEVSSNPYNEKYFEWWMRGKKPDFVTIYPVLVNDTTFGFIVGFGKNSEFDEIGSLKKIENLYTICKKTLNNFVSSKAA